MKVATVSQRQCSLLYSYCPPIWLAPALARTTSSAYSRGAYSPLLCAGKAEGQKGHLTQPSIFRACERFHTSVRLSRQPDTRNATRIGGFSVSHRLEKILGPNLKHRPIQLSPPEITDERLVQSVVDTLESMAQKHSNSSFLDRVGLGETDKTTVLKRFEEFWPWMVSSLQGTQNGIAALKSAPSLDVFRATYKKEGFAGVRNQLHQSFQAFNANYGFSEQDLLSQAVLADLRYPTEWYPDARKVQRTIHLHVGPTNSGKTYHALQRLEQAESGIYAGPLRLLAHEVFTRLNAKGKACNLVTGDEQVIVQNGEEDAQMYSCTVEMVALGSKFDVAVIDEIQMMAHPERGWAWTQALLGLRAKELHVCGETRSVPIIKELAAAMGDKLVIHTYERLNPLKVMSASLNGRLSLLRKGDAVVVFSKVGIHAMKKAIEKATGRRVAIVYGALPPEIRAHQAKLFNDEDNDYDFLVASDAIGMGLNLNIKRVIFESIRKFNGVERAMLQMTEIKQIAGRAGRFKAAIDQQQIGEQKSTVPVFENLSPAPQVQQPGYVTCFDGRDLPHVKKAMEDDAPPILAVGIAPPEDILQRFANHFPPQTPYSYVMLRLYEFARLNSRFFLCDIKDQMEVADALRPVKKLTISDLMVFCASPANLSSDSDKSFLQAMASCVAEQKENDILDLLGDELEVLDAVISPQPEYMVALESLHRNLVLYIWLSYRFGTFFRQRPLATHIKSLVEDNINKVLSQFTSVKVLDSRFKRLRKQSHDLNGLGLISSEEPESILGFPKASHKTELPETFQDDTLESSWESPEDILSEAHSSAEEAANPQEKSQEMPLIASKEDLSRRPQLMRQTGEATTLPHSQPLTFSKESKGNESKGVVEDAKGDEASQEMEQIPPLAADSKGVSKEVDHKGLQNDKSSLSTIDIDADRWCDDTPSPDSKGTTGINTSTTPAPGVALGAKALKYSEAMVKQTGASDHSEPQPKKALAQGTRNANARDYKKVVMHPNTESKTPIEYGQQSTLRPKDHPVSNFFTASDNGLDHDAASKVTVKIEEEKPMARKPSHLTTVDILDSLISRVPSFKSRTEDLRR